MSTRPAENRAGTEPGAARIPTRIAAPPLRRLLEAPVAALMFLTIIPIPRPLRPRGATAFDDAAAWFPLVGAAIGALAGAVRLGMYGAMGAGPATALAFLVAVGATGALHQDALADCADALGVRGGRQQRLEVMRGSTLGVYGILALGLWGLLMYSALEQMTRVDGLLALLTAGAAGRLAAVLHGAVTRPARGDGLGAGFTVTVAAAAFALLLTCIVAVLAVGVLDATITVAVCVTATALSAVLANRILGGRTGDTLGAAAAIAEVAVVVVLSALLMH